MRRLSLTSITLLKVLLLLLTLGLLIPLNAKAQCPHQPEIRPENLIMCPNSQDTIYTQPGADAYQWYQDGSPMPGATDYFLPVDAFLHAGYSYAVEVTIAGCTERSPDYLLDGWAFLGVTVMERTASGNGPFIDPITALPHYCKGDTLFLEIMQPYRTNIQWYNNNSPIIGATDTVLAVTESGNYWVEGAPLLCPNYVQPLGLTITAIFHNDEPQAFAIGSTTICTGDSVVLATNISEGIRWNTGDTTQQIVVRQPGRYWAVFDGFGCAMDSVNSVVVTALNRPNAPVATASTPNAGDTLRLFASSVSGATGYVWIGPNGWGSTDQNPVRLNAQPNMSGAYVVRAMGGTACESDADTVFVNIGSTAINPEANALHVLAYPNPTDGTLHLQLPQAATKASVELRDMMGRVVWASNLDVAAATLDISALPAGLYVLLTEMDGLKASQRIVKQ